MAAQSNSLQSIRYKRGSLELLDQVSLLSFLSLIHVCLFLFLYYVLCICIYQSCSFFIQLKHLICLFYQRRLPLETVYLDIHGATDGWYFSPNYLC